MDRHGDLQHGVLYTSDDDGRIKQICAKTHREIKTLRSLHKEPIYATCISNDGKFFVTSDAEGRIVLYDGKTGELLHDFGVVHDHQIDSLTFDKTGHFFFSGGKYGQLKKWSAYKKKLVKDYGKAHRDASITALIVCKDVLFSCDGVGGIKAWKITRNEEISEDKYREEYLVSMYEHGRGINAIAVSNNGEWLFSADDGGYLKQWNIKDVLKGQVRLAKNYGRVFHESVTGIVATPDNNFIYLGSERGSIKKFDILKMECIDYKLEMMQSMIISICISPKGDKLWFVDEEGGLKSWDTVNDDTICEYKKVHTTRLNSMSYLKCE